MIYNPFKLLLPALLPSWNFFDVIAPSPRIEFTLLHSENDTSTQWQEFRPRPAQLPFSQMLARMFWNPRWNETLFTVSCAERIMENTSRNNLDSHSENEILNRIINDIVCNKLILVNNKAQDNPTTHIQFRLLVIQREGLKLTQEVVFESRIAPLSECALPMGDDT